MTLVTFGHLSKNNSIFFSGQLSTLFSPLPVCLNGYPEGTINKTKHSQNHQKDPRPLNTEWSYLKMPYVSERLNYKITEL